MSRKLTTKDFISKAKEIHGETYDYSKSLYSGRHSKITITCQVHGDFSQHAGSHLCGTGCPKCGTESTALKQAKTTETFLEEARNKHGDQYDYSKIEYKSNKTPVIIICPVHGTFKQKPYDHCTKGHGCPKCGNKRISKIRTKDLSWFLERAKETHGERYNYSKTIYHGIHTKVTITCPDHGDFIQTPGSHYNGSGCTQCGDQRSADAKKKDRDEIIRRARITHGDKYDYSVAVYRGINEKISIICPKHGQFEQTTNSHIRGSECPKCHAITSRAEDEIFEFVYLMAADAERSDRTLISPKEVDIYIPSLGLAIEYCGLFWHSDYKQKDKYYHLKKQQACEEKGIRLITIFEDEWIAKKEIVKATLRHFLGKSEKGCFARKTTIREIKWPEAKEFLNRTHLLGAGVPGKYKIGAFDPNGNLIAVMTFGVPADERGKTDIVEMKRFCTDKRNHPGLGSKMFNWSVEHYGFQKVVAFVDRRWFTGEFKKHTGFQIIGETDPSLFWTDFKNRYHRRYTTKKDLSETEQFKGKSLTKRQMLKDLGIYRIWDCGKLKLEWKKGGPKSPKSIA